MTSLFSTPKPPPLTPPAVMPTADDADVLAAKRRALAAQTQRSGRASTILSDNGTTDRLGG
jgi:hypothetical protein